MIFRPLRHGCIAALVLVAGALVRADPFPAIPRADANSKEAHRQLLAKAAHGGVDVYFEGDSITRRWGATDWPAMLKNWNENFHGWNAGDFGWGADRLENILWRIENGELDGVNPKVIVLLGGTNNIGSRPKGQATVDHVVAGIQAVLAACEQRAPNATIILTAIFPRNDTPNANPVIDRINPRLAALADGHRIRFVNINAQLADAAGHLQAGLTVDHLHPSVGGYQIWADALKPILTELLGPPAATDHAPAPTGDPGIK
ncbi:MAG TPA: GDSL-type esterase/lipase family protein [Opitutaceae bacterium]|jgi:lysophospholipase L1-like esterase